MKRPFLLVLALAVAGLLVAADLVTREVASQKLAERVAAEVPAADSSSARIRSFPFLPRLLASGNVTGVNLAVTGVEVRNLLFDSVTADLHDVEIDRRSLVREGRVLVRTIRSGEVRAVVTQEAISQVLGVPIRLERGRVSVTVAGREVSAGVAVRNGQLVVDGAGLSLPGLDVVAPLLPCLPEAEAGSGQVVLSCRFSGVPRELLAQERADLLDRGFATERLTALPHRSSAVHPDRSARS